MGFIQTILQKKLEKEKAELRKLQYQRDILAGKIECRKQIKGGASS